MVGVENVDHENEPDGRKFIDLKHAPEGTHPSHLDGIGEDVENSAVKTGMATGYFNVGVNQGARMMNEVMNKFLLAIQGGETFDDVSGEQLDMNMVKAARALEMDFFERMGVYTRVPKAEAFISG